LLDLGCGTGAAGAAWALEQQPPPFVEAVDRSAWALQEAGFTLARLGLRHRAVRGDAARLPSLRPAAGVLAAFTVNELDPASRARLLPGLLAAAARGARVLVVEPLSRRVSPWWSEWAAAVRGAGGREDEWKFEAALPERLALLARAAGLDARRLGGRSLWLG
jgi:hypothetical protein